VTDPDGSAAEHPARRTKRRRAVRLSVVLLGGMAIAAFVVVWALPNVAGPYFVDVSALVAPRTAANAPTVIVADRAPIQATALDVGVEVVNHYPLSVVLGTGRTAFQAAVYRRNATGRLVRVWQATVDDPLLEEGSDSPVGGGSAGGAAVVPAGTSSHDLTSSTAGFSLVAASGAPLETGVYYLRVWAYGIASQLVPLSLDGGTDPLGTPTDVPAPSN
jgi:hypothetical protein